MTVRFAELGQPRTPLFYAEVSTREAGIGAPTFKTVLVGAADVDGAGIATSVPVRVFSGQDAAQRAGRGSKLALMAAEFFTANPSGECYLYAQPVSAGGTADVATVNVSLVGGNPAVAGELTIKFCGRTLSVQVGAAEAAGAIETKIVSAITGDAVLAEMWSAAGNVLTSRARALVAGSGNYTTVDTGGTGISVVITETTAGALSVSSTSLAGLAEIDYDLLVFADAAAANLNAASVDLTARWSPDQQQYGYAMAAADNTLSTLVSDFNDRNDPHITVFGINRSGTALPAVVAGKVAGVASRSLTNDPALPLQTVELRDGGDVGGWTRAEREALLTAGVSTIVVDEAGVSRIERMVTTYHQNALGQPDQSWYDGNTSFTLAAVLRYLRARLTQKFSRAKLADNGQALRPGSAVVTPNVIRGELISAYSDLIDRGWVENLEAFSENLIVERNADDPNRVDVLWPGDLINQLRVLSLLAEFRR